MHGPDITQVGLSPDIYSNRRVKNSNAAERWSTAVARSITVAACNTLPKLARESQSQFLSETEPLREHQLTDGGESASVPLG